MQRWALAISIACSVPAGCLTAQDVAADPAATDSTTPRRHVEQNLWISGGIGGGGQNGKGIAAVATGWYAYGPFVLGARTSGGGPWFGPDTHDKAALVGLRARSRHTFALFGVGTGMMGGSRSNGEQSGTRTVFPDEQSVAYGAEAAVTYYAIGIGVDVFGATSRRASYSGMALSVQLGYLK